MSKISNLRSHDYKKIQNKKTKTKGLFGKCF